MKNTTIFISQLPKNTQKLIREDLKAANLSKEDIETAMNSRLCDLEEILPIKNYL